MRSPVMTPVWLKALVRSAGLPVLFRSFMVVYLELENPYADIVRRPAAAGRRGTLSAQSYNPIDKAEGMAFKRIWRQGEVLAALDAGATLVTSGERLARAVCLAHGEARHAAGVRVWERPEVMSYGAFLDRLYDRAADAALSATSQPPPRRISDAAAEARWEQAVRASARGAEVLQPVATAREAARA